MTHQNKLCFGETYGGWQPRESPPAPHIHDDRPEGGCLFVPIPPLGPLPPPRLPLLEDELHKAQTWKQVIRDYVVDVFPEGRRREWQKATD